MSIPERAFVERIRSSDRWMIFLSVAIALCAVASMIILGRQFDVLDGQLRALQGQLDEMRRQRAEMMEQRRLSEAGLAEAARANEISREALLSLRRAFVAFDGIEQQNGVDARKHTAAWLFRVRWKNTGATPAQSTVIRINQNQSSAALPENFSFPYFDSPETGTFIGAGGTEIAGGEVYIPIADIAKVASLQERLYLYGSVRYKDIFHVSHITMFCWQLTGIAGDVYRPPDPTQIRGVSCPHHNCADEQCDQQQEFDAGARFRLSLLRKDDPRP
jgi:hypothetical protein